MSAIHGTPMKDLRGYMTPEEVKKVIDYTRNFRDKVMLRVLWATGCRLNEMLMLTIEDISWRDKTLLMWTLKRKKKNRYQRIVPVDEKTLLILKEYIKINKIRTGKLFHLTDRRVEQIVYKAGCDAGIPKVGTKMTHPHHFRHSHGVAWIRENPTMEGLRKLQQRFGHASITTTAHYLQYATEESEKEVESVFGEW